MWDLSSPTRVLTCIPCIARGLSTTGPPGNSLRLFLMVPHSLWDEDTRLLFIFSASGLTSSPASKCSASPSCSVFLLPPSSTTLPCLWCSLCLACPSLSQELLLILKGLAPLPPPLRSLLRLPSPPKKPSVFKCVFRSLLGLCHIIS